MKRRALLAATLALPFAAIAQTGERLPKIGVLMFTALSPGLQAAFRRGLRERGYIEGKNIVIEWRAAGGSVEQAEKIASELVAMKVNAIVTVLTPAAQAAKKATNTIPIVMALAGDPVATGLVKSLARPGGNVTGMSSSSAEISGKRIELLRELIPGLSRIGLLINGADPFAKPFVQENVAAAKRTGMTLDIIDIRTPQDIDAAFPSLSKARAGAVIVQGSLMGGTSRAAELAIKYRMPSMSPQKQFFDGTGWLMSFGADPEDLTARSAGYLDRILKGANPGDLPIEQPTRMELVINRKTARALGITIPPAFLVRADSVID